VAAHIVVSCEAITMNYKRNKKSKRNREYDIEYSRRRRLDGRSNTAEARERKKEYMRSYRARKKEEAKAQLNAGHIVGTLITTPATKRMNWQSSWHENLRDTTTLTLCLRPWETHV
jgi:hypothetical protein